MAKGWSVHAHQSAGDLAGAGASTRPAGTRHRAPTTDRNRERFASMILSAAGLDLSGVEVLDAFAGVGRHGLRAREPRRGARPSSWTSTVARSRASAARPSGRCTRTPPSGGRSPATLARSPSRGGSPAAPSASSSSIRPMRSRPARVASLGGGACRPRPARAGRRRRLRACERERRHRRRGPAAFQVEEPGSDDRGPHDRRPGRDS